LTALAVNEAGSESESKPGSVAVKVIISEPNQSTLGVVIVAILEPSIETVRSVFPEYVHDISESGLSMSAT